MKSLVKITGLLFAVMLIVSSCKKSVPKQINHIPKDATVVFSVNAKQLQDKLAKGNLSIDSLVKLFADVSRASDKLQKMDDLKNSGIDWSSDLYVFMQSKGSVMMGQNVVAGAIAATSDASKFEAFIKKQSASVEVKKGTDYSFAKLDDNLLVGWNKELVIAVSAKASRGFSSSSATTPDNNSDEQTLASLFGMKEADAVASISEFRDLMQQKSDATFWTNSSAALAAVPMLGMTKATDLLNETYTATTISFEDGKVTGDSKYYLSKALIDILKKHKSPDVDYSMIEHYPSNNISGYGLLSFDPQIIGDIVRFSGLDATVNQFLAKEGLTMDDVLKAFKGDFSFVYSDFETKEQPSAWDSTIKIKQPTGKYLLNIKVGDKASFEKVAAVAVKDGMLTKQGNTYVPAMQSSKFDAVIDDKNILVASDNPTLQQYKAGSAKIGLEGDAKDQPKGKSLVFFVDIAKLLNGTPATDKDDVAITNQAKATFKSLLLNTDGFNGKTITSHGELRTANDKENSLVSLVKFFSAVNEKEKQRRANEPTIDNALDSVASPTIVDSVAISPVR